MSRLKIFKGFSWGWVFTYLVMLALVVFIALPFIYMISAAFMPLNELTLFPPRFIVRRPTFRNFIDLVGAFDAGAVPFTRFLFNSVFTTTVSVAGVVMISCMGAFAVEKLRMPGSKVIFKLVIWGLMFSPPAAQIPIFIVMTELGLRNTYWALIIPGLATPMYFFLVKQFMTQVPDSLLESARMDGAGEWKVFFTIIMPMTRSAWATVTVFAFIANWNNASGSIIYITDQAMRTLPFALATINDPAMGLGRLGAAAAAALLTTLPVIVVFLVMQARVMNAMAFSGIKG